MKDAHITETGHQLRYPLCLNSLLHEYCIMPLDIGGALGARVITMRRLSRLAGSTHLNHNSVPYAIQENVTTPRSKAGV